MWDFRDWKRYRENLFHSDVILDNLAKEGKFSRKIWGFFVVFRNLVAAISIKQLNTSNILNRRELYMKILITGGLGQVGSHVAEMFLDRGDQVLVVDNLATGRREHLEEHDNLSVVIGSIADIELVDKLFNQFQPESVVHTAASYKDPNDWYNDSLTNCVGGSNVISAAVEHDVKRFIYFQTSLCYGLKPLEQPITLSHPKFPASTSYAITKTANEDFLEICLDFVTFRLANVVGPRNVAVRCRYFIKDSKTVSSVLSPSREEILYLLKI